MNNVQEDIKALISNDSLYENGHIEYTLCFIEKTSSFDEIVDDMYLGDVIIKADFSRPCLVEKEGFSPLISAFNENGEIIIFGLPDETYTIMKELHVNSPDDDYLDSF